MENIKEQYNFVIEFIKKHGESFTQGSNTYWNYDGENIKIFFREFMKKSSFIIIQEENESSFFINYAIRKEITAESGEFTHLERVYNQLIHQDPIKEMLFCRNK